MYKIIYLDNQIVIREDFKRPIVYLDHWALNDLSLDPDLRNRFVKLMNERGGTLRLSIINMKELSKQADKSQVDSILDMIESIDECGLIDIDPDEVIRKEDYLVSGHPFTNPSAELDIVADYLRKNNNPGNLHVVEIIKNYLPMLQSKHMTQNGTNFLNHRLLLEIGRGNEAHIKKASNRLMTMKDQGPTHEIAATRELYQMALDFVWINRNMRMSQDSEWDDIFHVIVPVAYCDAVLIDKKWKTFIAQTGFSHPKIAKVFDRRSLDNFFQAIENWEISN